MKKEIIYLKDQDPKYEPTELIEVDEDTSFYGNYEQDGKQYASMRFGKNFHFQPIKHFDPNPYIYQDYYVNGVKIDLNELSSEDKIKALMPLGIEVIVNAIQSAYYRNHLHELQESYYPYRLTLAGNDDDSWTKYFPTEEAMLKEVERLRNKQPINKDDDVKENGYFFTN